jgi:F0F1-type ATP synthase membrane subunit b/b'
LPDSKLKQYVEQIVNFETEIKALVSSIAEDSRSLITQSQTLSQELEKEAKAVVDEIEKLVQSSSENKINELRKEFTVSKDREINELRKRAQSNLDKAVKRFFDIIKEVYG